MLSHVIFTFTLFSGRRHDPDNRRRSSSIASYPCNLHGSLLAIRSHFGSSFLDWGPARGTALGHGAMAMMYPGQLFFVIPVEMVPAGGWAAFCSDPPYPSEVFAHQGWAAISSDTPYPSEVSAHQGWAAFSSDTPYPSEVSAHQGWAAFNSDTPYPSEESARCSTTTELNPAAAQLNPSAKPFVPSLKKKASTQQQQ